MVGAFGIIDETEETHAPEASTRGICLAPSIEALAWLLKRVGFSRVERLLPPPDGYEQLVGQKRAMFAAWVD
jgi:tRNA (mo5U34)-methyltransferase